MKFQVKTYEIPSVKIGKKEQGFLAAFLTDLHLAQIGPHNDRLYTAICQLNPDVVLVGGDMIIAKESCDTVIAESLLFRLAERFPVYYANGNHEQRRKERKELYGEQFFEYKKRLTDHGIIFLENQRSNFMVRGVETVIYGLELPLDFYGRFCKKTLDESEVTARIGTPDPSKVNILLAHNPQFRTTYLNWGADLILSGHIHGGIVRLGNRAVVSPQGKLFPSYGYGIYTENERYHIVSGGLGEHTIPLRIWNPRELVAVKIKGIKQEVPHGDTY